MWKIEGMIITDQLVIYKYTKWQGQRKRKQGADI